MAKASSTISDLAAVTIPTELQVVDVVFDHRRSGSDAIYTYRNDLGAEPGQAVTAPMGARIELGIVLACRVVKPFQLGFPVSALKPIQGIVDGISLPAEMLELLEYVSASSLSTPSHVIGLAMPPGLHDRLVTQWTLIREPNDQEMTALSATKAEAVRVLKDNGGSIQSTKQKPISTGAKRPLRALKADGLVAESLAVSTTAERHRLTGQLRLTSESRKIDDFLLRNGKRKPAQAMILMRLQGAEAISFSVLEVKAISNATDQAIMGLIKAGLLEKIETEQPQLQVPPKPNPSQASAISAITKAIDQRSSQPFLLFGVTGSGKTEVYLRAAAAAMQQGRQVLYLVPEIALTAHVIAQLRSRFGKGLAVIHSNLPAQERLNNWVQIAEGKAPIVLGARSALFAPLNNLGLIIMDEEHEGSYKQEAVPRYHARDAAIRLAQIHECPIILGSATPSIESYFRSEQGEYQRLELPQRAAAATLPTVHIQDLTEVYKTARPSIFSPMLLEKMHATLARKEQIILFLNRRAFASFLVCRDCGHQWTCPDCAVAMSFHKRAQRLKCHHCGHQIPAPDICPACDGNRIAPFGTGSERVEETVRSLFPEINVARLDRDVAEKRGALEEIFAGFRSQSIQILVGTQMIAKGLDFPNVTLVGVIAADISLNVPDFRASERTFQLLSQVAGRAGRGERPGEVVIQTMVPGNVAIQCAMTHDYVALYETLLQERLAAWYPPYCHLVNVVFSGEHLNEVESAIHSVADDLRTRKELIVLGPVECPIERLNGRWRLHMLLKLKDLSTIHQLPELLVNSNPKSVNLMIDVNPYSLM